MFTYHTTKPQNTWKWKLTDLKGQIDKSTLTVGDVNTLLSATQRTTEQKISKDTEEPTTNNQQGLTGTCRQPHQTEHTFFSKCPWTFTHRDGAWALKQTSTNLKESKSYKICFLTILHHLWSHRNQLMGKSLNCWKPQHHNTLLNNPWIKKFSQKNTHKTQ